MEQNELCSVLWVQKGQAMGPHLVWGQCDCVSVASSPLTPASLALCIHHCP